MHNVCERLNWYTLHAAVFIKWQNTAQSRKCAYYLCAARESLYYFADKHIFCQSKVLIGSSRTKWDFKSAASISRLSFPSIYCYLWRHVYSLPRKYQRAIGWKILLHFCVCMADVRCKNASNSRTQRGGKVIEILWHGLQGLAGVGRAGGCHHTTSLWGLLRAVRYVCLPFCSCTLRQWFFRFARKFGF